MITLARASTNCTGQTFRFVREGGPHQEIRNSLTVTHTHTHTHTHTRAIYIALAPVAEAQGQFGKEEEGGRLAVRSRYQRVCQDRN
jgi:hypothetical protein